MEFNSLSIPPGTTVWYSAVFDTLPYPATVTFTNVTLFFKSPDQQTDDFVATGPSSAIEIKPGTHLCDAAVFDSASNTFAISTCTTNTGSTLLAAASLALNTLDLALYKVTM
jgi:hypothetical protein